MNQINKKIVKASLLLTLAMSIISCNPHHNKQVKENAVQANEPEYQFSGCYVSSDYANRDKGYNWIAVIVKTFDNDKKIQIKIRSRADKGKPLCTFDATASRIGSNTFKTTIDNVDIFFKFDKTHIRIETEKGDEGILSFYCANRGTIEGKYYKINGLPDQNQMDATTFSKIVGLNNIGFKINARPEKNGQLISITPFGINSQKPQITINIKGNVIDAETADLDNDGLPELLIFTARDSDAYGDVICYSVEKDNTIQAIPFVQAANNFKINAGYNGFDSFKIIDNALGQSFPIFNKKNKTTKQRQIYYNLVKRGNHKVFIIQNILEYKN